MARIAIVLLSVALLGQSVHTFGTPTSGVVSRFGEVYIGAGVVSLDLESHPSGTWIQVQGCQPGEISKLVVNGCDIDVTPESAGTYEINYSISFSGGVNKTHEFGVAINNIPVFKCRTVRQLGGPGDVANVAGSCIMRLFPGNQIDLIVRGTDATVRDITVHDLSWILHSL